MILILSISNLTIFTKSVKMCRRTRSLGVRSIRDRVAARHPRSPLAARVTKSQPASVIGLRNHLYETVLWAAVLRLNMLTWAATGFRPDST